MEEVVPQKRAELIGDNTPEAEEALVPTHPPNGEVLPVQRELREFSECQFDSGEINKSSQSRTNN